MCQAAPDLEPGQTPLGMFLEQVSLVSDSDDLDTNAGAVTLLTLHTAKGLEYPVVFIVGLEDGILPHSRTLEIEDAREKEEELAEERRLFYVGITRAKRRLYLVHAFRRSLWGDSNVQAPSRFLDEIPDELLTGMVDKRGRQESSFKRMTSWQDDDDVGSSYGTSQGATRAARPGASGAGAPSHRRPAGARPEPATGQPAQPGLPKAPTGRPVGASDGSPPITRKSRRQAAHARPRPASSSAATPSSTPPLA